MDAADAFDYRCIPVGETRFGHETWCAYAIRGKFAVPEDASAQEIFFSTMGDMWFEYGASKEEALAKIKREVAATLN